MATTPVGSLPANQTSPAGTTATGDAGQSVVNDIVKNCPWIPSQPNIPITQGYGTTSYTGEPSGHGQPHWHAGVDLGVGTGTVVEFPATNGNAVVQWLSNAGVDVANILGGSVVQIGQDAIYHRGVIGGEDGNDSYSIDPEGYGDHPVTLSVRASGTSLSPTPVFDVILGHGMAWLQNDGDIVRPGDQLLKTDCEGNCSGPHLHFEVRPYKGGYGTDVDPWGVLTNGTGTSVTSPTGQQIGSDIQAAAQDVSGAITGAVDDAEKLVIGLGMSALGTVMMGGAGWIGFQAIKGAMPVRTATGVVRTTTRTLRRPASGGAKRSLMPRVRPASGGPTSQASAPRTTPAPPQTVAPPPRTAPAPAPSALANVGASAVAKVSRGANPSTLTAAEGAWLKAHPDQLVAALRAAGKAA
jgi:murein DD-endopeptidase MepM/ murein hydrolase activator NlpD